MVRCEIHVVRQRKGEHIMTEKQIRNYRYIFLWTDEITYDLKDDYVRLHNRVFNTSFSIKLFNNKFVNNIYGISVHVLVYDGDNVIAIRSLWRNDLGNIKAYQPCDTAVLEEYRGNGIFKVMTDGAIDCVGDALIYNYPNNNSRKLYLRNGWEIKRVLYKHLFILRQFNKRYKDALINDEYVKWYFSKIDGLKVQKRGEYCLLLSPRKMNMYIIIGIISKDIYESKCFERINSGLLFYRNEHKPFIKIFNHPTYVVGKGDIKGNIPTWKADAV